MLGRFTTAAALLALALAVGAAAGFAAEWYLRNESLADAFARLRLFHALRQAALEDYVNSMASDVRAASENPKVVDAIEKLSFAWSAFNTEARETLQRLYREQNQLPAAEKYKLDDAGDGSYYSAYHREFHDWAKRFREHFGYYDVFLISPKGDILYTVAKESDFATNLKTGPYRASPLADVFRRALAQPDAPVDFSDFARYGPSNNDPAAFAAHAVKKGDTVIGVFAVQIPAEPLNALMHFTAGMGATGETYLVGADGLMRSQSRFLKAPTLLETKVENASTRDGLSGGSGAHVVPDYRGIPVLSVYAPVDFGGQKWVLLAEIDEAEVLGEVQGWIVAALAAIAGFAAAGLAFMAHRLSRNREPEITGQKAELGGAPS